MLKNLLQKIENPSADFRGAPFWAWNGKLEPKELREQIRLMKEMGLGGFFMHARVGLNTEYLGKDWFDCVRACVDEAKKQDMNAWLYDEDRWPSGAAGGIVTKDPRFRVKFIRLDILKSEKDMKESTANTLGIFAAKVTEKGDASGVRKLSAPSDKLEDGESLLYITMQTANSDSWYNGETYLDTMNPDAVKEFIRVTHEAYKREEKNEFGKTIKGIFSDEPCYENGMRGLSLPWTKNFPEEFEKRFHYDLSDHLPELFFVMNGEEFSKVRLDYFNCATDLFVKSYSKQIGEWCGKNDMEFTGHVLCEDTLTSQKFVGGAAMRFYEYMQAPGIDLLTEHWLVFNTAKQCVSMAHQFGRQTRLSETYGCTGWDFPFFGHKALGDWQLALGINLRCQHLAWYTMEAQAKRDYPASIFYQSPWYREYPVVENYFARVGALLSEGEEVRELLVIHPIESVFGTPCVHFDHENELKRNLGIIRLTNLLLSENLDFDFGDEDVMARHGSVQNGRFEVAKASYKAILIPELLTIRETTLELLKAFAENGGKVFYLGKAPALVGGEKKDSAKKIFTELFESASMDTLAKMLSPFVRMVSIRNGAKEIGPVLYQLRAGKEFKTLFLCNTGKEFDDNQTIVCMVRDRTLAFPCATVSVQAGAKDRVWELNTETGKFTEKASSFADGLLTFKTSFTPLESHGFIIAKTLPGETENKESIPAKLETIAMLGNSNIPVTTDEQNLLVLDRASYSVNGSEKSGVLYFMALDDELRKMLGKPPRGGRMCQPWKNTQTKIEKQLDLELEYTFVCKEVPQGKLFLAVERPDLYKFRINGKDWKAVDSGFWCDHAIRRIALPENVLQKGVNKIEMKSSYHEQLPGIESMFLLGDFGVRNGEIVECRKTLEIGDWCSQGFENYAGNLTYRFTLECNDPEEKLYLTIPETEWRGASLGVCVNSGEKTSLPWPPYTVSLAGKLKKGENVIEITVFGHRRNAFGPFHLKEKWPIWTGPEQFRILEVQERQLVPCGLMKAPLIQK